MGLIALLAAALASIAATRGPSPPLLTQRPEAGSPKADSSKTHVVFVIGEQEYDTRQTLPAFAEEELEPRGFRCTFVYADSSASNSFPGLEAVQDADLLFLSVRRRTPPKKQLTLIRRYLKDGGGLVAIRTSSHAFALREGGPPPGHAAWPAFDTDVLGGRYENHYGNEHAVEVFLDPGNTQHPVLRRIRHPSFRSQGTLYRSRDLDSTANVLMRGRTTAGGKQVTEPVAWTNTYSGGRVFYTSLGHPGDFERSPFRHLLVNAVRWGAGRPVPGTYETMAASPEVAQYMNDFEGRGALGGASTYTPPRQALGAFEVSEDLEIELVASEPSIFQPVHISFDDRGRLWVVQYNQYPYPAGLKITGLDQHLRANYSPMPPPPPPGRAEGADRITVLEDTDGDGRFDEVQDVIEGLSLATSVARGRGGIWVLNPPYLLKYPDPEGDGLPNGEPAVHLEGFGLQDTHSTANSLRWGPDGWLYGASGSTTVDTVSSAVTKDVGYEGQAIWRYHPRTKVFEIFAEGGGNTFDVTFDAKGRLYSGNNGGDSRAFHYKQGAYYRKNWGKHGALTNPYAFGYFDHMLHTGYEDRFTHAEIVYEGTALPDRYDGTLISVNPLQNRMPVSRLAPLGSTFETIDTEFIVETPDDWFRPVDIITGPDGGVYVADWYDDRLSHVSPEDTWHRASGRVYRIKKKGEARPVRPFDLSARSTGALIDLLAHPNPWFRRKARRILGDRRDETAVPRLQALVEEETGQLALEALWALNLSGGFDDALALKALDHPDPHVRRWTVRLVGDARKAAPEVARRLARRARTESDAEVRSQLAASAKRLPARQALPIVRALMGRSEDADDLHLPLQLWWVLEDKAVSDRQAVLALFEDAQLWAQPVARQVILERLMQRYVAAGGPENLSAAARLLERALSEEAASTGPLMAGLEKALQGSERDITDLPARLTDALQQHQERIGESGLALSMRQGEPEAVRKALKVVASEKADVSRRLKYIRILGETRPPRAAEVLLERLVLEEGGRGPTAAPIQRAALQALMRYEEPEIGERVAALYPDELRADPDVRAAALELLASRRAWAQALLGAIGARRIDASDISVALVQRMEQYDDPQIEKQINRHWPGVEPATSAEKQKRIAQVRQILSSGTGDPRSGQAVFASTCGTCHRLHGQGSSLGPPLTGYDRDNTRYMVQHIVAPSVSVREGYVNYLVRTKGGRTLTGFITDRSGGAVTLQAPSGRETTVAKGEIAEMQALKQSVMPEGLLEPLSKQEVRDLFAYLESQEPPADTAGTQ